MWFREGVNGLFLEQFSRCGVRVALMFYENPIQKGLKGFRKFDSCDQKSADCPLISMKFTRCILFSSKSKILIFSSILKITKKRKSTTNTMQWLSRLVLLISVLFCHSRDIGCFGFTTVTFQTPILPSRVIGRPCKRSYRDQSCTRIYSGTEITSSDNPSIAPSTTDILVCGGGPSGLLAAIMLSQKFPKVGAAHITIS